MSPVTDLQPESSFSGGGGASSRIQLSSEEVNILIYLYLIESNLTHTAFTFLSESSLKDSNLFHRFHPATSSLSSALQPVRFNAMGRPAALSDHLESASANVARGELIRKLWKGLRWEEIEYHSSVNTNDGASRCNSPFHLLIPHICSGGEDVDTALGNSSDHTPDLIVKTSISYPHFPSRPARTIKSRFSETDEKRQTFESEYPPIISNKKRKNMTSSGSVSPGQPASASSSTLPSLEGSSLGDVNEKQKLQRISDTRSAQTRPSNDDHSELQSDFSRRRVRNNTSPLHFVARLPSPIVKRPPIGTNMEVANVTNETGISCWIEHRDAVTCLAWNPRDNDVLITGSSDGTARLWNFHDSSDSLDLSLRLSKKPSSISHKSIDTGKKVVTDLVWHPDGTVFATAASDGVGRLFTPSGQLQGILSYGRGAINSLKFSPSGSSLLAAKDDFTVCLFVLGYDLKSQKQLSFESHTKEVNDVDWLDDDTFASAGNDRTIFVYRTDDRCPRFTFKGHTDDVTKIKWSPNSSGTTSHGKLLASASDDGSVMIWRLPNDPSGRSISPAKLFRERENNPDINSIDSLGSEDCLHRLIVVNGVTENKRMNTLEWSPLCKEGRMIIAAGGQDSTVKLFDALAGECLHILPGLESGTGSISFSPICSDGTYGVLAGGGWNGKIIFWDVKTGKLLKEYEVEEAFEKQSTRDRPMMMAMAWRNDGQQLAVGLHNKSLLTICSVENKDLQV